MLQFISYFANQRNDLYDIQPTFVYKKRMLIYDNNDYYDKRMYYKRFRIMFLIAYLFHCLY